MVKLFKRQKDVFEIDELEEDEVAPEDYRVVVRFRPNTSTRWKTAPDVQPPLELVYEMFFGEDQAEAIDRITEWLKEEYGGGYWKIDITDKANRILKSKTIYIPDEDIKYGISKWVVYVKGTQSGRWYKADVEFDHFPSTEEIIDAIGGGGKIKVVGLDDRGRTATYKIIDIDAPEPEWLKEREDSLERKLQNVLKEKLIEAQERVIKQLVEGKSKEDSEDPIDKLIKEIEALAKSEKLRNIEELLKSLREGKSESKKSLSDVLFLEPYKAKVESVQLLIKKFAEKGDLDTARALLHEIPDGTGAIVSLIQAGANLANAIAMVLAGGNRQLGEWRERVKRVVEETRKEREEKKEEIEEEIEEEEEVKIEESYDEEGWEIKPSVEG